MKTKLLLIGSGALALVAVPLLAQGMGDRAGMDAPKTRTDVESRVKEHFSRMDANRDGTVTAAERSAQRDKMRAERHAEHFNAMDTNKDGMISRAEFDAGHAARRDGMKDGKMDHHGEHARGMHDGMGMRGMGMGADADKDGNISLDEARTRALARFDAIDTNKDGTISEAEHKAAKAAWGGRRDARQPAETK